MRVRIVHNTTCTNDQTWCWIRWINMWIILWQETIIRVICVRTEYPCLCVCAWVLFDLVRCRCCVNVDHIWFSNWFMMWREPFMPTHQKPAIKCRCILHLQLHWTGASMHFRLIKYTRSIQALFQMFHSNNIYQRMHIGSFIPFDSALLIEIWWEKYLHCEFGWK